MEELSDLKSMFRTLAGTLALHGRRECALLTSPVNGVVKLIIVSAWTCQVVRRSPYSLRDNEILGRVLLIQGTVFHPGYLPLSGGGGLFREVLLFWEPKVT